MGQCIIAAVKRGTLMALVSAALALSVEVATAQDLPPQAGPARTAKMFDLFCLRQLPDIGAIAKVAKAGEFTELAGAELKHYQPQVPADELHAWRYKDFDREFTLVVTKSKPDRQFKTSIPAFANSTNYACSLITPGRDMKNDVIAAMTKIMERKPDESWNQAPMQVHAWSGQTEKLLVQVFHYAGMKSDFTSLLSASTFVKE